MPNREDIVLLATYNASMNRKLYAAAATLPQDALRADRGAFFGSVLGTLNHIVAGDTIWLRRFMAHPSDFASLRAMAGIAAPAGLTHRYSDDLDSLREHRVRLDAIIETLAAELSDADVASSGRILAPCYCTFLTIKRITVVRQVRCCRNWALISGLPIWSNGYLSTVSQGAGLRETLWSIYRRAACA
jgi:hypothetical protein